VNTNTITKSGASPWAAPIGLRKRVCIVPNASVRGSGVPFAGYGALVATKHAQATPMAAAHTTLVARKDDAQVPEPRGRKR
jgi:hypothetical protein